MLHKPDLIASSWGIAAIREDSLPAPSVRDVTVSGGVARAIVHAAQAAGVSRSELLLAARISPDQLKCREARLPKAAIYRLCEQTVALSADPALGLHWAEKLESYTFELLPDLISRSATLRAGLQSLTQFVRLLEDEPSFEIKEYANQMCVRSLRQPGASASVQRFVSEVLVLRFWRLVCEFGAPARTVRANFEYSAPSYRAEYARVFEGAERFDQPFTGVVFDRALMDARSPHEDEDVLGLLRSIAERRMLRLADSVPYAARARECLVKFGTSRVDMEKIARSLGLSGRTLRRRLAAEGVKYEQVVNEAMAIVAKQLLATTRRSIQDVSTALGFAHTSGFHRAFKRLTGMTPVEYRRRASNDDWAHSACSDATL